MFASAGGQLLGADQETTEASTSHATSNNRGGDKIQANMRWLNRSVLGIGLASLFSDWPSADAALAARLLGAGMGISSPRRIK
jgi:hypothetical protein